MANERDTYWSVYAGDLAENPDAHCIAANCMTLEAAEAISSKNRGSLIYEMCSSCRTNPCRCECIRTGKPPAHPYQTFPIAENG